MEAGVRIGDVYALLVGRLPLPCLVLYLHDSLVVPHYSICWPGLGGKHSTICKLRV